MTSLSTQYSNTSYSEKRIAIHVFAVVTTVLLLLSVYYKSPYMTILFLSILPIGLWKPEYLIPVFLISSLSSNYFLATEGIGFTRLLAFTIITGVLFRIYVKKKNMIAKKWIGNCLFIIVASLISFLFAYDDNIDSLYTMVLNVLVFIAFANLSLNNNELEPLFRAILLVVIIVTIFLVISLLMNPLELMDERLTADENVNVNRFGMMTAQLAAYALGYIYFTKKFYVKIVCLAVSFINIIFVILSASRSALVGVAFGFISTILIYFYCQKQHIVKNIFVLVIICVVSVLIFNYIIDASPIIADRMNPDIIIESGGTRRWPRIIAELQYIIPDHILFGVGQGAVSEELALSKYGIPDPGSSHNIIISLLAQLGVIGFIAYMVFWGRIISDAVSKIRLQRILIIPLMLILTAVFNGVGEVIYSERLFWNAFALAVLCIMTYRASLINPHARFGHNE